MPDTPTPQDMCADCDGGGTVIEHGCVDTGQPCPGCGGSGIVRGSTPQDWKPEETRLLLQALPTGVGYGAALEVLTAGLESGLVVRADQARSALVKDLDRWLRVLPPSIDRDSARRALAAALVDGLVVRAEELAETRAEVERLREDNEALKREAAARHAVLTRRTDDLDALREFCRSQGLLPDDLPSPSSFDRELRTRLGQAPYRERAEKAEAERDSLAARLEAAERVRDRLRAGAETCRQAAVDCEARNEPRRGRIWREVYLARSEAADELSDALEGEDDHAT